MDNNIPDAPNEIEEAIADIETIVSKTVERQEILNYSVSSVKQSVLKFSNNWIMIVSFRCFNTEQKLRVL